MSRATFLPSEFVNFWLSTDHLTHRIVGSNLPDLIKRDLDSLRADVWEYYSAKVWQAMSESGFVHPYAWGVAVIQDQDQDSTDL